MRKLDRWSVLTLFMVFTFKGKNQKSQIINKSLKLFQKHGYSNISLNDIIKELKISKGAFYHYFKSKEEIIISIAEVYTIQAVKIFEEIINRTDINALEKFNEIIANMQLYKGRIHEEKLLIGRAIGPKLEDPILQQYLMYSGKKFFVPLLSKLFREGVAKKIFKTKYPDEIAEHYLDFIISLKKSLAKPVLELSKDPKNKTKIKKELDFFQDIFEKLLGVKPGSINLTKPLLKRYLTYKFE